MNSKISGTTEKDKEQRVGKDEFPDWSKIDGKTITLKRDIHYEIFAISLQRDFKETDLSVNIDEGLIVFHSVIPRVLFTTSELVKNIFHSKGCHTMKICEISYDLYNEMLCSFYFSKRVAILENGVRLSDLVKSVFDCIAFENDEDGVMSIFLDYKFVSHIKSMSASIIRNGRDSRLLSVISYSKETVYAIVTYVDEEGKESLTRIIQRAKNSNDRTYWEERKREVIMNMTKKHFKEQ